MYLYRQSQRTQYRRAANTYLYWPYCRLLVRWHGDIQNPRVLPRYYCIRYGMSLVVEYSGLLGRVLDFSSEFTGDLL